MTQAVPEAKTVAPTPAPETIQDNGLGVPSAGHIEPLSNESAVAQTVQAVEEETGAVDAATQELITEPDVIKAEPSADHTQQELHADLEAAQVKIVSPHSESQELGEAAQKLGGRIVGEVAPSNNPNPDAITFTNPSETPKPIQEPDGFPPVEKTGILGNTEKNGGPLMRLARTRFGQLKNAIIPKLLGGQKDSTPPLIPKTT